MKSDTKGMDSKEKTTILVQAKVDAPLEFVWECWTNPEDIVKWNKASDDWHTTRAVNDLRVGGKFIYRMEAKDGSAGFDFEGVYNTVKPHELIENTLGDGRKVKIEFAFDGNKTHIFESFEPEKINTIELQRVG